MANQVAQKTEQPVEVSRPQSTRGLTYTPRVDIVETAEELVLYADLPGVKSDGVDVRFENGELVLHGRSPARQEGARYLLNEYGVGDFHRVFSVAETIDPNRITAELKHGVLAVHLPKSEAVKPRRIQVKGE